VEGPAVAASFSEASINSATRDDDKTKELNISAMEKPLGLLQAAETTRASTALASLGSCR